MLEGRNALVTGSGSAQGDAVARAFFAAGAKVAVAGTGDAAARLAADLDPGGKRSLGLRVDDADDWAAAVAKVGSAFGALHIAVLGLPCAAVETSLSDLNHEAFHRSVETGFVSSAAALGAIIKAARKNETALSVIQVCSDDARTGRPGRAANAAVMGGLLMYAKTAALECAGTANRINVLLTRADEGPVDVDRLARAALLLARPDADFLSGAVLPAGQILSSVK